MNSPDPDEKSLHDLNLLLYNFPWNGKHDKIKRSRVCQAYEAGGLKMADVRSFLSALKTGWLKRILCDNGNYKDFTDYVSTSSRYYLKPW